MHAIILAAGKGTRMRGLCDRTPKPMLPLANRPMLRVILDGLAQAGIERAHVVVGHLQQQIRAHFADEPHPLEPDFIEQTHPNGTGSAAGLGRPVIPQGEPFLLVFGDIIVSKDTYANLVTRYAGGSFDALLTTRRVPDPCHGAAVYVDGDGRVTEIIEKPEPGTSTTDLDNAGLFLFPYDMFDLLDALPLSPRGEYELTDAIAQLVAQGRIGAHRLEGFWFNMTDPEALVRANAALIEETHGRALPDISNCTLTPPVAVGMGCRFENGGLGPNVSVGSGSTLERDARIANALLLGGNTIGRGARVEHAVIAPGQSVDPGARIIGTPDDVRLVL